MLATTVKATLAYNTDQYEQRITINATSSFGKSMAHWKKHLRCIASFEVSKQLDDHKRMYIPLAFVNYEEF